LIVKELVFGTALLHSANRFVRQQQRREIMRCFALLVNSLFSVVHAIFTIVEV
jgi:hypothetical protein